MCGGDIYGLVSRGEWWAGINEKRINERVGKSVQEEYNTERRKGKANRTDNLE